MSTETRSEWVAADYRDYRRWKEQCNEDALSFGDWLATQLPEYRETHGVES